MSLTLLYCDPSCCPLTVPTVTVAIRYNFKSKLIIITKELDQKGFNQKAYERQILRKELAEITKAKKIGKG